jgi:hypothetical protein
MLKQAHAMLAALAAVFAAKLLAEADQRQEAVTEGYNHTLWWRAQKMTEK